MKSPEEAQIPALLVAIKPDRVRRIPYLCHQCGAQDAGKFFLDEPIAPAITCWGCKSGHALGLREMVERGIGMFPVEPEEQKLTEEEQQAAAEAQDPTAGAATRVH